MPPGSKLRTDLAKNGRISPKNKGNPAVFFVLRFLNGASFAHWPRSPCPSGFHFLRLRIGETEGVGGDAGHDDGDNGAVEAVRANGGDAVYHVHAADDLTEGRVLSVKVRGILVHDEELAAGRIRVHGSGHGEDAGRVAEIVRETVHREFAADLIAGTAHAVAVRAPALDHEAFDDPVEGQAVVKALIHQGKEVAHGVGGDFRVELRDDLRAVLEFKGYLRVGDVDHNVSPFWILKIESFALAMLQESVLRVASRRDEESGRQMRRSRCYCSHPRQTLALKD